LSGCILDGNETCVGEDILDQEMESKEEIKKATTPKSPMIKPLEQKYML
jgi:hypothetical protein